MSLVNIAGLTPVDDPSYRYKMPRLQGKVEGRGNGIKTVLVNVVEVAQALNRGGPEVTKFFGTELGAQTTYDESIDRAIVNGAHTDQDLLNKLKVYIEKFVLCPTCHLPETHYKIKDGTIAHKCLACGGKNNVDMAHKLTTFILAQHKKAKDVAKKEEAAKAKKDKKDKKEKKDKGEATGDSEKASPREEETGKKAKKEKKEKKAKKEKENGGVDETAEKKKSSKKSFFDGPDGTSSDEVDAEEESDAKAVEDGIARMKIWLANNPDINSAGAGEDASSSITRIADELRAIQTVSSLRPVDRVIIYIGSVFTSALITNSEVAKNQKMLCALAPTPNTQRHIIAAMEWFCGSHHQNLASKFPIVLKQLFDEEIVEEDVFYDWSADYAKNDHSADDSLITIDTLESLKASAQPFVTWLREADEEGDSSEEESD